MARPEHEEVFPLFTLTKNYGDSTVNLSSLKQMKDILLSLQPFDDAELFLYSIELQTSPDMLVREYLLEESKKLFKLGYVIFHDFLRNKKVVHCICPCQCAGCSFENK
ncbi:Hypothetical predicted protein [Olea europaea subsp. europaea]|uniref:Uncharacterized protein n=1 Tax=Olea europaea subsp. europaea TaxID=158383 RepID=A0A8S0QIJ8_OLEEU|nr:Hypothetical predicted protein [Olea europaea subsp. europaea]